MAQTDADTELVNDPFLRAIKDDTVKTKTGKSWQEWYQALDSWGANEKTHNLTARHLRDQYSVSTWWSNAITARYRWVRGLKEQAEPKAESSRQNTSEQAN